MTIAIVGPHGVGKTTLGEALASALGCPFHAELGRGLAEARRCLPQAKQPAFDIAVLEHELARDRAWETCGAQLRVVETWHIGNLAYALARSPAVGARYDRVRWSPAVCIAMDCADDVLDARQSEPGCPAFFRSVGRSAPCVAQKHGVPIVGRIDGAQSLATLLVRAQACLADPSSPSAMFLSPSHRSRDAF